MDREQFCVEAVFSDETEAFVSPQEPEKYDNVRIRIRTAKDNADEVWLVAGEDKLLMDKAGGSRYFDYYEAEYKLSDSILRYYFIIKFRGRDYYYNRYHVAEPILRQEFNFKIIPGFKVPEWSKGAVFYQIFTDRFCNGDKSNDVYDGEYEYLGKKVTFNPDWYAYPSKNSVGEFFGGDLEGVLKKLDYLKELGVEVLYLNPIFVSPSNHKYDTQDYENLDPHFGVMTDPAAKGYSERVTSLKNIKANEEFFVRFVNKAHKKGFKVVLDGVFNHCGSFNKWLDREGIYENAEGFEKGAYKHKDSPYHTFFKFRSEDWPDNTSYDGWWGYDTLPKLNYEESPILEDYILRIAKKWIAPPFNVDGWRLDVAADLGFSREYNHKFWEKFRNVVKEANPNAIIIAEHYESPEEWLDGKQWDTVMNYAAFMEPVTWFLTGMEKHSDEFRGDLLSNSGVFVEAMRYNMNTMPYNSIEIAMNELSNHDHSRFMTRTSMKPGRVAYAGYEAASEDINPAIMYEAVVMQMTWPGAPTLYYGDEAGVCGWTDPDNRRTYPWGYEEKKLLEFHKEIINIHKSYETLRKGSLKLLVADGAFLAYGRFKDNEKFIVAINNSPQECEREIPVWLLDMEDSETIVRMMYTDADGYRLDTDVYRSENGNFKVKMGAYSSVIYKNFSY